MQEPDSEVCNGGVLLTDIAVADEEELECTETESMNDVAVCCHCTEVLGLSQPFKGQNVKGLLRVTNQTGGLIETLAVLGAKMCWASCGISSTQTHAAAAVAKAGTSSVFAWKGKTLPDYWLVHRANDVRS